jgi:hypothetical protein
MTPYRVDVILNETEHKGYNYNSVVVPDVQTHIHTNIYNILSYGHRL